MLMWMRDWKAGDKFVAFEIVGWACLEKDVAFVEEQNGVPLCNHLKNVGQFGFDLIRVDPEIAGGHHIQRSMHVLSDWFRSECLRWC
jgi:hypothetical protein